MKSLKYGENCQNVSERQKWAHGVEKIDTYKLAHRPLIFKKCSICKRARNETCVFDKNSIPLRNEA